MEAQQIRILEATADLFNEYGFKFTMQQLASKLKMSKKTLYVWFDNKRDLFHAMADYIFDAVQERKREIYEDPSLDLLTRIRLYLGTMPEQYRHINLHLLNDLRETHPDVYEHVARRLENDWDTAILLLERGMQEGILREFSIPVFKVMMEASLEQFFQKDVLVRNHMSYQDALAAVVDILLDGVRADRG